MSETSAQRLRSEVASQVIVDARKTKIHSQMSCELRKGSVIVVLKGDDQVKFAPPVAAEQTGAILRRGRCATDWGHDPRLAHCSFRPRALLRRPHQRSDAFHTMPRSSFCLGAEAAPDGPRHPLSSPAGASPTAGRYGYI